MITKGGGLRYCGCVTNQIPETSPPIIYGVALSTPVHVVAHLAQALIRYQKRIGTRWRAHDTTLQAILTIAWLEGGHTYRKLGEGNGVPKKHLPHPDPGRHQSPRPPSTTTDRNRLPGNESRLGLPHRRRRQHPHRTRRRPIHQQTTLVLRQTQTPRRHGPDRRRPRRGTAMGLRRPTRTHRRHHRRPPAFVAR